MKRIAIILLALIGTCVGLQAQKQRGDSISLRPSFGVDLTSEVHTDFREGRLANLLQLYADIPSTTVCKDFCGLGAKYAFKRAELGCSQIMFAFWASTSGPQSSSAAYPSRIS